MKRKLISLLFIFLSVFTLASCSNKDILLFLNWGEYVDEELLDAFEDKYNCIVVMDLSETNEIFYSKVRGGTTIYDVVCPSDYMVEKMYENDMLEKLDFTKLDTFVAKYAQSEGVDLENDEAYNTFVDGITSQDVINYYKNNELRLGVQNIYNQMNDALVEKLGDKYNPTTDNISNYFVPYLWGTWGICYTTRNAELVNVVKNTANPWDLLCNKSILPANTKVAMYDSAMHAYFALCKYLGYDTHSELPKSDLDNIIKAIKDMGYTSWGTDQIKKNIVSENLDLGFMWTGDFLYYYAEQAVERITTALEEEEIEESEIAQMLDGLINNESQSYTSIAGKEYKIGFDLVIPDDTIAFCDNLVMTKDAKHKDLAYKFIDFMNSNGVLIDEEDPETEVTPQFSNTYYVDYDAPTNAVYDDLVALKDTDLDEVLAQIEAGEDIVLEDVIYDIAIGYAFDKYYPKDTTKGKILANFDRKYINTINKTLNNAKV